jgi:hypothetical protein
MQIGANGRSKLSVLLYSSAYSNSELSFHCAMYLSVNAYLWAGMSDFFAILQTCTV